MTDGVVAFNKSGKVIQKNPAAEDMLARPIGEETTLQRAFADAAPLEQVLRWNSPAIWDRSGLWESEAWSC